MEKKLTAIARDGSTVTANIQTKVTVHTDDGLFRKVLSGSHTLSSIVSTIEETGGYSILDEYDYCTYLPNENKVEYILPVSTFIPKSAIKKIVVIELLDESCMEILESSDCVDSLEKKDA